MIDNATGFMLFKKVFLINRTLSCSKNFGIMHEISKIIFKETCIWFILIYGFYSFDLSKKFINNRLELPINFSFTTTNFMHIKLQSRILLLTNSVFCPFSMKCYIFEKLKAFSSKQLFPDMI